VIGSLIRGGVAGGVATWLMDRVTTGIQQQQSREDAERETAVRPNGQESVVNLVQLVERRAGLTLDEGSRSVVVTVVHYGLGVVPGAFYAAARRRMPGLAFGRGLLFGALLFLVNDEFLNTALGTAAPPQAYPASTHFRGLVGHLVLGAVTDVLVDAMGG
jgi:uncharacterized membrane protein YagU involved in acid resistance